MSQRLIIALATLATLGLVVALPPVTNAQTRQQPTQNAAGHAAHDSTATGTHSETTEAIHQSGFQTTSEESDTGESSHAVTVTGAQGSNEAEAGKPTILVDKNANRENVTATDQALIIAGHVRHDVVAVRSDVTILPGASVGGHVIAFGGKVSNLAGSSVKVILSNSEASNLLFGMDGATHLVQAPTSVSLSGEDAPARNLSLSEERPGWFESQFGLLVLGMLGASILIIAAPRATQEVAESIALRPARSLTIGFITALILTVVLGISFMLTKGMPKLISLMWSPFGTVIALAAGTLLAFGWLTGMRFAGDRIARAFGRPATSDGLYARMSLGLVAFFLANSLLGSLNGAHTMGIAGLTLEFAIALMGLGAAIVTRLGKAPDHVLGSRLR